MTSVNRVPMSMKAAGKAARAKPAGVLGKLLTADNKLFMPASNDVSKKTVPASGAEEEVCVPSVHETENNALVILRWCVVFRSFILLLQSCFQMVVLFLPRARK